MAGVITAQSRPSVRWFGATAPTAAGDEVLDAFQRLLIEHGERETALDASPGPPVSPRAD